MKVFFGRNREEFYHEPHKPTRTEEELGRRKLKVTIYDL
jgi:hypothetical protein